MYPTKENEKKLHLIVSIVTSLLLVISGVLFVISCYSIYRSGSSPFTRESIARSFEKIAVPIWITVSFVIIGGVLSVIFPKNEQKLKGKRTDLLVLRKIRSQRSLSEDSIFFAEVRKEEKLRFYLALINVILIVLGSTLPLLFLLNPNNFPAVSGEYNSEVARGMIVYLTALLPVFVYEMVYVILFDKSVKKQIKLCKSAAKCDECVNFEEEKNGKTLLEKIKSYVDKNDREITLGVRIALLHCGVTFVVIGAFNGGMADVLQKAIKICTECIGLG